MLNKTLSLLNYCNDAYYISSSSNPSVIKTFKYSITEGLIIENVNPVSKKKQLVIAISGTKNLKHWFVNSKLHLSSLKKNSNEKVHSGYLRAAILIYRTLKELKLLDKKYESIICCGHSKGGATASILNILLVLHYKFSTNHVCFRVASPKIGNIFFFNLENNLLKSNVITLYSYVNNLDIVPKIPFYGYYTNIQTKLSSSLFNLFKSHSLKTYYNILSKNEKTSRASQYSNL